MKAIINGREYPFEAGETILEVAKRNDIYIPTLCHFQPIYHNPGTCRICLVEEKLADGGSRVVTSCNTVLTDGMRIETNTPKIRRMRKLQLELIFADHDQDCVNCARHGDCELQDLGRRLGVSGSPFKARALAQRDIDTSMNGMVRDMSKCIRCLRCVDVCRNVQGVCALTVNGEGPSIQIGVGGRIPNQAASGCIQCGQCTLVCPTGALSEKNEIDKCMDYIDDPDVVTVFSFAPSVRVTLGEAYNMDPGCNVEGRIVAAMRRLGADIILDTDFGADLVIMEEGTELLNRIKNNGVLPMFTSCCPGWMNFAEKHVPQVLPHVSTTRSPQGVQGALIKTYLPEKMGLDASKIRSISVMPCTAKKDEAARPQLATNGVPDNDLVLTVREFAEMLDRNGIDLNKLEPEPFDNPFMSDSTGAAVIFGTTGGVMEAAIRTVYAVLNNGKEIPGVDFMPARSNYASREAEVDLGEGNGTIKIAICYGLANAKKLAEEAVAGQSPYTFIEVMACPGGCVDGGGTCRVKNDYHPHAAARQQGLYNIDKTMPRRQSHNNPQIKMLYADYLGEPNSHKAHELLHTSYTDRSEKRIQSIATAKSRVTLTD